MGSDDSVGSFYTWEDIFIMMRRLKETAELSEENCKLINEGTHDNGDA